MRLKLSTPGAKALACWAVLLPLTLLNPVPTGGAMLITAPLSVYTFYYTHQWWASRLETDH